MNKTFNVVVNGIKISNDNEFVLISGPCVIESEEITFDIAKKIKEVTQKLNIPFIFKASFDKANRSSIDSFRGLGIENGLKILKKIREELQIPILSDIHLPNQAMLVKDVVDIIQIPALLSRQTDLIVAAAQTGKPVLIKKGQFLSADNMHNIIKKCHPNNNILLCERGNFFGYGDLVVDFRNIAKMKNTGYPTIFDGGHSVQKPGGKSISSGGEKEFIKPLCKSAISIGISGIFLEVHTDPSKALSDGDNMLNIEELKDLLTDIKKIDDVVKK